MIRKLKQSIAALAVVVGAFLIDPGIPAAEAHTNTESFNICRLIEIQTFGAEQNNVGFFYRHIHLYGFHITQCCYVSAFNPSIRAMAQFVYGFNELTWPQNDPWCR